VVAGDRPKLNGTIYKFPVESACEIFLISELSAKLQQK